MTEEQRDQLLLDFKEQFKIINSKLAEHDEQFKIINSKLAEHDEQFKIINSILNDHTKILNEHTALLNDHTDLLSEHDREIRSLSRSVAFIEVDHGNKLQALLDVTSGILEKLESFEKRFESNEADLENHSIRILNLESKVGIVL